MVGVDKVVPSQQQLPPKADDTDQIGELALPSVN
jgi:hypothetical protein